MAYSGGSPIYWGTAYADNARPVYIGTAYADNAQPVYEGTAYAHGAEPVYQGTAYAHGASAIYMSTCFPLSALVHVDFDEYVPIASLKIGDKICSWDTERKSRIFTMVTNIHLNKGYEVSIFNDTLVVSPTHPLMVLDYDSEGTIHIPKWKLARDVNLGDFILRCDGISIAVQSKKYKWFNSSIEVLNLDTENGTPFIVDSFIARANNASDDMEWTTTKFPQAIQLSA